MTRRLHQVRRIKFSAFIHYSPLQTDLVFCSSPFSVWLLSTELDGNNEKGKMLAHATYRHRVRLQRANKSLEFRSAEVVHQWNSIHGAKNANKDTTTEPGNVHELNLRSAFSTKSILLSRFAGAATFTVVFSRNFNSIGLQLKTSAIMFALSFVRSSVAMQCECDSAGRVPLGTRYLVIVAQLNQMTWHKFHFTYRRFD